MYIVIVSDAVKGTTVRVYDRGASLGCVSVLKTLARRRRTIVVGATEFAQLLEVAASAVR